MKNKIFIVFVLSIIVFVGIITRFYKLGGSPSGLYLDEAAQGYNAYSILKTGKDEFGKFFPIVFRSFTDFKTPVYIYLIVPLIPIFGLTKFTVRFPSFFFSILTLPILFLLIRRIAPKKLSIYISLLTTLLLAISPWHILFGRTNFECNVALSFFLTGIYFFYLGLEKPKNLIISAFMFAVAIPSYHSQRIVTPLTMLILFIENRKILLDQIHKKFLLIGLAVGFIISLPTLSVVTTPGFLARASGLNIFNISKHLPAGTITNYNGIFNFFVNSPLFLTTREFLAIYLSYFSPRNMFLLGDSGLRSSFPELSTFFVWQFPFYIYGLYILIRDRSLKELRFFTIVLLLIAPIPAAVTRDPYSTIRALPLVIPQIIIISLGIIYLFKKIKKPSVKYAYFLCASIIIVYSLAKLYSSVIVLNEHFRGQEWNYGWEQVTNVIKTFNDNRQIVVDNSRSEPYSQLLFFLKFDPSTYQKDNFEVPLNQYYVNMNRNTIKKIGNIITRPVNWEIDLKKVEYLIGDELAISYKQIREHNLELISEIKYPDGSIAFRIVKTPIAAHTPGVI
ncbi:hypothetical protein A3D00_02210 [Candidatus Woesebacteria bacterium RIFCSPHIGHO2_02_FULL_38_9]|nr:MAG: hypothetical protein A3D00_02210 [Candidatus Woesebacteria bacterium RIFCSPHIGHO2_02_FULL_38_9]